MIKKAMLFLYCLTAFPLQGMAVEVNNKINYLMGEYKIDDGYISGGIIINNNKDGSFTVVIDTINKKMNMCGAQFDNIRLSPVGDIYVGSVKIKDAVQEEYKDIDFEDESISIALSDSGLLITGPSSGWCGLNAYYSGAYSSGGYVNPKFKALKNNIYETSPFGAYLSARQYQIEQKIERFDIEETYVVTGNVSHHFMSSDSSESAEYPCISMKGGFIAKLKQNAKFSVKKYVKEDDKITLLCTTMNIESGRSYASGICTPVKIESEDQNGNKKIRYINKELHSKLY